MNISWANLSSHRFPKKGDVRSSTVFRSHYSFGDTFETAFCSIFLSLGQDLILFVVQDMEVRNKIPIYTEITEVHL